MKKQYLAIDDKLPLLEIKLLFFEAVLEADGFQQQLCIPYYVSVLASFELEELYIPICNR